MKKGKKVATLSSLDNKMDKLVVTVDTLARMMQEGFDSVEERMATKEDLRGVEERMATKEDLRGVEERLAIKLVTYESRWAKSNVALEAKSSEHEKRINRLEDAVFVGLKTKRMA